MFAKTKKNSVVSSVTIDLPEVEGALTNKDTHLGDDIFCDQYMSPIKCCLIHTRGKEFSIIQLYGGTIFVVHTTIYIFNNYQVDLTAASTIGIKHQCESKFDEFGVQIKKYAANNQSFRSKVWVEDCTLQFQLPTSHSGMRA